MLTNLDTNINTKEEFINTIFYFVESLPYDEYREMCVSGKIAMRTIVFAHQQRAIYKGGDMYCPMEDSTFLSILLRLLNDEDLINALINFIKNHRGDLPIATKELLGVIMVGATLTITNQGVLDVDIEEVEKIIKKYIKGEGSSDFPKASKEEYGVVKIGDGIAVNDGVISVSFGELPEQTKQDLLNLVLKFIRENANFRATYNRYGVVKIKEGGGILVNDGVISIDPIAIPTMPSIPDPVDYSITSFSLNGNNLTISQNNNSRSLVVDLSQYVNPGGSGSGSGSEGQNGGHYEFAYKNSATKPNPPAAGTSVVNLTGGWTTTPADPGNNEYTWMSWCFVNGVTGEYGTWSTPIRITGQKGDKGDTGAAGSGVDITVEQIDQITNTTIQEIKNQIEEQNNYWNTWVDNEINNAITQILHDLNDSDWFTIMNSSGWDEEMKAYLQRIGLLEVYTDSSTGETTIRDRFSEIIQRLQSIEATVGDINVGVDDQGNMLNVTQLKSDIATWLENNDEFKGAIRQSIQSYIDWDAIGNTVTSAVSALQQRAGLTENGLEAVSSQTARVDNGEDATLSAIQAFANEQRSSINLTASFSKYKTDGNGNYVYYDGAQDGYEMVYESDSDGKAIPYCGIKVFYVKSDGTLTLNESEGVTKKRIVRLRDNQNRVRLWDTSNNEINLDTATENEKAQGVPHYAEEEVKDGNNNPVKDRKAKMVYYTANSNGNYNGNSSYVFEEDLPHDSNGQLVWVKDSTYEVKFIDENGGRSIAYRKNRKMENISFSSLGLDANEQGALATLVANYQANNGSGIESHAALTELSDATSAVAALQSQVTQTQTDLNNYKTDASTTFVTSSKYDKDTQNFVTKGGIISAITASPEDKSGLVTTLSVAGVLTSADLNDAQSTLYSKLGEKYASIDTAVTRDSNGVIQSNVTISADQITALTDKIDARAANVTVRSLSAKSSRANESDPYNEVLINGTAGIQVVPNRPTNNTPSTRFNLDGSGYLANGNISWNTAGDVTFDQSVIDGILELSAQDVIASSLVAGSSDTNKIDINAQDGIKITPAGKTSSVQLNPNGSGSIANGNISWNANGEIIIKDPQFRTTNQSGNTVNVSTVLCTDVDASGTVNTQDLYTKEMHFTDLNKDSNAEGSFTTGMKLVSDAVTVDVYVDNQGYLRIPQNQVSIIYNSLS